MAQSVFVVQHLHRLPDGEEDVKLAGVFSSRANALAAITRLAALPGFSMHPGVIGSDAPGDSEGFYVDEYLLDQEYWSEGFVTL